MPTRDEIELFNPSAWVKEYTKPAFPVSNRELEQILFFSLIWNIFEREACNRRANKTSIAKSVSRAFAKGLLSVDDFEPYITFFRDRASCHHDGVAGYIDALAAEDTDTRNQILNLLSAQHQSPPSTLTALLLIALRVRNNLFHGNKEVAYLHAQTDLFIFVNSMLAHFLSKTKGADQQVRTSTFSCDNPSAASSHPPKLPNSLRDL